MMRARLSGFAIVVAMVGAIGLVAQAPQPPPAQTAVPTLTEAQRAVVENRILKFTNAQLQLELARRDVESVLRELQKPGYDFDLQTLTYVKKVEQPHGPAGKEGP